MLHTIQPDKRMICQRFARRALTSGTFMSLIVALLGCNGAHLYNASEDDLAKKAQSSFNDAKLSGSLTAERTLMDSMRDRELKLTQQNVLARRDLSLVSLLLPDTKVKDFAGDVDSRLKDLAGNVDQAALLASDAAGLPDAANALALAKAAYRLQWRSVHTDDSEPDFSAPPTSPILQEFFETYSAALKAYQELATKVAAEGDMGRLAAQISEIEANQAELAKVADDAAKAYNDAKKKYDDQVAASNPPDFKGAAADIQKKLAATTQPAKQAQDALEKINLGGLGLIGAIQGIEAQQQNLNEVLEVVIDGKGAIPATADDKTKLRLTLVSSLTSIGDQLGTALNYPRVGVLLLESNRLQINLDAVKRRMSTAEQELACMKQERDALSAELVLLVECHSDLQKVPQDQILVSTLSKPNDVASLQASSALLEYGEAWTVWRVAEEQAKFKIIALRHQASLDESDIALAQWQNLIGEPISQLVSLYGSGIKAEDVANLIHAAGLGAIGYGTNNNK